MSDDSPNGSPTGTPATPPPGYPAASSSQPTYPQPTYPQATYPQATYPQASSQPADQGQYGAPAYPPQQQYGYGAYGYAPKTNSLAIVSLVSGIAAFVVLPFIASVVAVITGHISLKQLKTSGEAGRGMALAGTILGWVGIGLGVLLVIGVIVFWGLIAAGIASSGSSIYDYS